jgi:serine/threonine-protein kinase
VGTGTSSRVFLAIDLQLKRRVAVKLLHEALAEDQGFLQRFRAEARAAGALNHPNIVSVFDWGEDTSQGVLLPYLVTEYLGGGSLRSMLDQSGLLSQSQTLVVGLQTARALAHAHLRGLVHRDVKPGNLLFDEEGRLRLADFGLARALAEASWTEPSGSMAGSTRYASPEQALGRRLDGRSDVYSLALILVECVTGRVPLVGETTASTLALRTQSDVELDASLGGLRSVLERAGRLDPADRPEAAEFEIALMAAAEELARPEPLPIVLTLGEAEQTTELRQVSGLGLIQELGADPVEGDYRQQETGQEFGEAGTQAAASGGIASLGLAADQEPQFAAVAPVASGEPFSDQTPFAAASVVLTGPETEAHTNAAVAQHETALGAASKARTARKKPNKRALIAAVVAALVLAVAGWWFFIRVEVHDVPDLIGLNLQVATDQATELGYIVDSSTKDRQDGTVAGQVLAQSPAPKSPLAEGSTVQLTVSLGATLTPLPAVAGLPEAEARAQLLAAGVAVGSVTRSINEDVAKDAVISATSAPGQEQVNAQGEIPKGTVLDLAVSDGPAPRVVPEGLVGSTVDQARAALAAVQLEAAVNEEFSETAAPGYIISSNKEPGAEVPRGYTLTLGMSKGPQPIAVPDVRNLSGSQAAAQLESQGLTVSGIEGPPSGLVLQTDPTPGELVPRGTAVRIFTNQ